MSYHIALDPGRNTGFALWDAKGKKFVSLQTLNFWQVIEQIKHYSKVFKIHSILIENPGLNKPVFMSKEQKAELTQAFEEMNKYARIAEAGFNNAVNTIETAIRVHASKAQKVGMNKEHASLLIDWLQRNNYNVIEIRPSVPKLDHVGFCELTGWKGRTNEHVRDAGRIAYGIQPQ